MGDHPLQLLKFSRGTEKLLLNKPNLNSVLDQAQDKPISVVTICGSTHQDKGFLLSYVARYLEALEQDNELDWMDWDNKSKPLDAFPFQSGVTSGTKGIWIWSRPFIITNDEGVEVTVILMDTQGINSQNIKTNDMGSIIFGLSLLTSSVLIFNFLNNLQEDALAVLNTYIQFGMLAQDTGKDKPFQKLIFLIRDWDNPAMFPYGTKGGKSFLREKMFHETVRNCFEKLECFLMPPIGEKASSPNFTGSISELNNTFALKLEDFINTMITGSSLPIKKILGNEIKASELASLIEKYVELFNSDHAPSAETIFGVTSQIANDTLTERTLKIYNEHINKRKPKGKKYIPNEALARLHTASEKHAWSIMKKKPNRELKEELVLKLKSQLAQIIQQNEDGRRQFIDEVTNDARCSFRDQLEAAIPLEDEDLKFYEDSTIKKKAKDVQTQIFDGVYDKFYEHNPEDAEEELASITQSLEPMFESMLKSHLIKNKDNLANADLTMNEIVEDLHSKFEFKSKEYFALNKFEEDDAKLDQTYEDFKSAQLRSFHQKRKPGGREFHQEYQIKLVKKMDSIFSHLRNHHKLRIRNLIQEAETFMHDLTSGYEAELVGVGQGRGMSEAGLRMVHSMKVSSILEKFQRESPFPKGNQTSNELEARLNDQLQKILNKVVTVEVKVKKEQAEKSYATAKRHSLEHYEKEIKTILTGADFLPNEKLEREHERLQKETLSKYDDYPKLGIFQNAAEIRSEIRSTLNDNFEAIKKSNQQRRLKAESDAKKYVQNCEDEYDRTMQTDLDNFAKEQELKAHHEKVKATIIHRFRDACSPSWEVTFIRPFEEALKSGIEEKYQELKDALQIKTTEAEARLIRLLVEATTHYHDEMRKHFRNNDFMNPANLLEINQQVKQVVIKKLDGSTALTTSQKEGLNKEMDELFAKYAEKNYMNANSGQVNDLAPAIGIDLGTTYCCVAVYYRGEVHVVANQDQGGDQTTPSYVAYDPDDGTISYGKPAKDNAYKNPEYTIYDAKRILGRKMTDRELQNDMKFWPFTVKEDESGTPKILVGKDRLLHPEQISAKLLIKCRKMAEKFLNLEPGAITKAVITVPAYFDDGQRQATVDAGDLAGLEVLTILNEPTAAAISYSMERLDTRARKIVVYDLGGGTFDVVVLDMKGKDINVLGVGGDTHLGGEDFDKKLMEYCAACFKVETGVDLFAGKDSQVKQERDEARRRLRRLQTYCEKAKRDLAVARKSNISVDGILDGKDLLVQITREKFEELNMPHFTKSIDLVDETLKGVGLCKTDIDDIVLVGGSSRILKVQEMLEEYFEGKALNRSIHPDHAVAYGAAVQAAILNGEQAKGKIDLSQIQDVTPMSLGIELSTKKLDVIIPKNSKIPDKKREVYYTYKDDQTSIVVKIYQGEDLEMAANNKLLGEFVLNGIPPNKEGEEAIDVWMSVNSMGILHVEAICRSNRGSNSLTVLERKGRMGDDRKKNLLGDAGEYAETACQRRLKCHHRCGGVKDEVKCLPCLQGCVNKFGPVLKQDGDDMCMICYTDALSYAPAILLECGHVFHYHCSRAVLESRYPGPKITFSFSNCPICKAGIKHVLLDDLLFPIRELFEDVKRKSLLRLAYEGLSGDDEIVSPGGRYFQNPSGFAMSRYSYFVCFKCQKAYFGGEARCDAEIEMEFDPAELVCGGCSDILRPQLCPKHGTDFLEYKCRYCCSVAIFFCFGTTHFCNECHNIAGRMAAMPKNQLPKCPAGPQGKPLNGAECPLHVAHPPTGEEFALGCGVCANAHTF